MRIFRFFIAALVLPALWSCTNIPSDFKFDSEKSTGVVVGSISYESSLSRIHLFAESTDGKVPVQFSFGCKFFPCLGTPWDDPKFSAGEQVTQRAGGFAVEVPAGTYRLTSWKVERGDYQTTSKSPIDIVFTVEKGKASYIGNLHFDAHWKDVQLRDKASRDLPALRATYPILSDTPLAFTIADGTVINKVGGTYQTRLVMKIYIPVVR